MSSSITNYTTLQTYIARLLAREGDTDVTAYIPDFIHLCETDLNMNLRAREMMATVNINPSATNKYVPLPTGFMEIVSFNDDEGDPLEEVSMESIQALRYASGSGDIEYYAITSQIEFERTGNASNNFPMTYYKELDLSTDTTNDILSKYPNLYVYGSALHAAPFLHDDKRIQTWSAYISQTIKDVNKRARKNQQRAMTDLGGKNNFNILRTY